MNAPDDRFDQEDFDPLLEALFRREHAHLPAEPFSSEALQAVARERKRALWRARLATAAAVLLLIALSPLLIDGSIWLSSRLDDAFARVSSWLATPYGIGAAALVALAAAASRLARVW